MSADPRELPRSGNPKKNKNARRKARPGWRPAQAAYGIGYVPDPEKPFNRHKRVAGQYVDRLPEPLPSPAADSAAQSPEGEKGDRGQ